MSKINTKPPPPFDDLTEASRDTTAPLDPPADPPPPVEPPRVPEPSDDDKELARAIASYDRYAAALITDGGLPLPPFAGLTVTQQKAWRAAVRGPA